MMTKASTEYKANFLLLPESHHAIAATKLDLEASSAIDISDFGLDRYNSSFSFAGDASVLAFRQLAAQQRPAGASFGNFHKLTQPNGVNAYSNNRPEEADVRARIVIQSRPRPTATCAPASHHQGAELPARRGSAREAAVSRYQLDAQAERLKEAGKTSEPVKTPADYIKGKPVDRALDFISDNFQGSGIKPEVLAKLKELQKNGKIVTAHMGDKGNVAEWNQHAGTITINADKIDTRNFMAEAGMQEARAMRSTDPAQVDSLENSSKRLQRHHSEQILELSGALIHEGTHAALGNTWSAKNDESAAYQAEAVWLGHLHRTQPGRMEKTFLESMNGDLLESSRGRTSYPITSSI